MKCRDGWVSNSSSTSFIIATRKKEQSIKVMIEMDISECVDYTVSTIKELDAYYLDEHSCGKETITELLESNDWLLDTYNQCGKLIEDGMAVHFGSGSSEGGGVDQFIYDGGINGIEDTNDMVVVESGD